MKKVLGVFLAMFVCAPVYADTSSIYDTIKAVVDHMDPTPEMGVWASFKDIGDQDFSQLEGFSGISGALYKFTSDDIELGSIRLGGVFENNRRIYTTIGINGIGLAKRYLSDDMKEALSPGFMPQVYTFLDKYGSVALGVGMKNVEELWGNDFSLSRDTGMVATVGISLTF